jgi:2-dehydro-3-deoxyglucarate aldolase
MNRLEKIKAIRQSLAANLPSIGSWMQIPHSSVAEVMGQAGYDWVAVDLEHGSISVSELPDLFRAIELGGTLPLARIAQAAPKDCKQALDAGAGGVIVPMIESASQLLSVRNACRWPPSGNRGVAFSRANLFGKNFQTYFKEAQSPLLVAMIENQCAVKCIDEILAVDGLDAILIGPYDLSASLGVIGQFDHPDFCASIQKILRAAKKSGISAGMHLVSPNPLELHQLIEEGYRFIAYSIDAVFLNNSVVAPKR